MTRTLCERTGRSAVWAGVAMALLCASMTLPANAAEPSAEDTATARALAVQGIELADAGDCKRAIPALERAEALRHAPTILGRLGECQIAVGQLVLGTENLMRVVRESLPANAPASFKEAQTRAQKALDAALPRIAKLKIVLEPPVENASLAVDGTPVPSAVVGIERATDPGTHTIAAQAAGYQPASSTVTLAEGATQSVTIRLEPVPGGAPVAAPPPQPQPPPLGQEQPSPFSQPSEQPQSGGKSRVPAYVALGIGGAGLIAGTVTGILANSKKGDLDCPENQCGPSQHDTLDSAKSMATISTVAFGVGIAGVAVGTVLLFTSSKESSAATTQLRRAPRPRQTRASIGLGSFHFSTEF